MNNEVLNDEFLKSIDSNYEFSNKPIRRLKKSQQPGEIKLQLENPLNLPWRLPPAFQLLVNSH